MAVNNTTILDQIWLKGSNDYQQRVPKASQAGVAATQRAIFSDRVLYNEFQKNLVNRIGLTLIHQRRWENPLAFFKVGMLQFGDTIQEVANKLIKAKGYEMDAQTLLKTNVPESKVAYHNVNRQDKYPITINDVELRKAFIDDYGLNNYINSLLEIPFTSDNYDEYNIMLNLIALHESYNGGFFKVQVADVVSDATGAAAKNLLKLIRAYMGKLKFLSALYNKAGIPNHTDPSDLVLIITPEVKASLDVDALATLFHIDKAEVDARIIEVDQFPIVGAQAVLVDKNWFVCGDYVYENTSFWNPETLSTNYWLHHWGVYSTSPFMNAVLFTTADPTTPSVVTMTMTGFAIAIQADGENVNTVSAGGIYDTKVTLTGSVSPDNSNVVLTPDSFTYTIGAYGVGDNDAPVAIDLSDRTYIDRAGKLHIQDDIDAGTVITINAISTYVDPSSSPIPGALTGTVTVTVE